MFHHTESKSEPSESCAPTAQPDRAHDRAPAKRQPSASLRQRVDALEAMFRPTPIVSLEHERVTLMAKLESQNPIGSVKDRPAYWVLKRAIERGDIGQDTTIIESSSGNFAVAMATLCAALGLSFVPVIDPNISKLNENLLRMACRHVEMVSECDEGGFLKARLRRVHELRAAIADSYWPNQYGNPDCAEAHMRFAGSEIAAELTSLDYIFVGVSSGGTIAGLSQRLKERFPRIKVIAVDAEGSLIFGGPAKRRYIPGIGSSIVPPLLERALIDDVVIVPEVDTVQACRTLRDRQGMFLGGSSGSLYAAVERYFARETALARPKVLFIAADRGVSYLDTIYSDPWAHQLGAVSHVRRTAA